MSKYVNPGALLICVCLVMLTACSVFRPLLIPENTLLLLPPSEGPADELKQQKVTVIQEQQSQTFIALSRFRATDFRVAVMMPTGQTMLTMSYDGRQFESTNLTDMTLPLEEVMSVMQFALWPENTVHKYYDEQFNWKVESVAGHRRLFEGKTLVLDVMMSDDKIDIHHKQHHYRVVISPLQS